MRHPASALAYLPLLALAPFAGAPHVASAQQADSRPEIPGREQTTRLKILEFAADVVQTDSPVAGIGVYLVGFHPMKHDPMHQMEAHHFCNQLNQDFMQCVLFDDKGDRARMTGVEYIVSEKLFEELPEQEKKYWHPHNYEILSGQLVAPGVPDVAEDEFMKQKMNSYGKTWHFWSAGHGVEKQDPLPFGEPMLAWSFNADGEAREELAEDRDRRMGVDGGEKRARRQHLVPLAHPQEGVDALEGTFPGPTSTPPGVAAKGR